MYNTRAGISTSGVTTNLSMPAFSFSTGTNSTSMSDASGNLLFAFDGNTVIDADLNRMPAIANLDLYAMYGKTLIQQIPGTTQYYIFYTTQNNTSNANSTWTLKYLIVDMALRGGKGDVTIYNKIVSTTSSPSYTLVENNDGTDIWLITHKCATDTFYNYKITSGGIANTPVLSKAGGNPVKETYVFKSLKTSFDGKMIAGYSFYEFFNVFLGTSGSVVVFDFNSVNGILTYRVHTRRGSGNYFNIFSLDFSADNRLLYVGSVIRLPGLQPCGLGGGNIRQYNLCYTDSTEFERYSMTVASDSRSCAPYSTWGEIQMGADKRIHAPFSGTAVSTFSNPNRIGSSCNFIFDSYQLPENNYSTVLTPDFQHKIMNRAIGNNIVYEGGCFPSPITFSITNDKIASINWNFGDPSSASNVENASRPSHIFSAPGIYTVSARFLNDLTGKMETIEELIEIKDPGKRLLEAYPRDTTICERERFSIKLNVINGVYQWYRLDGNRKKVYTYEASDSYTIEAPGMQYVELRWNDCNGCVLIDSINVTIKPTPWTYLGNDQVLCSGDSLKLGFNEPDTRFLWSTGETSSGITIKQGGLYWLEAEYNNNGCVLRDSMFVTQLQGVDFSLPADTTLCNNQQLLITTGVNGARSYRWQDGSTQPDFTVTEPGVYHVQVNSVDYCFKRDTIVVDYVRTESVFLGNDTSLCDGSYLELTSAIANADLLWSTGSSDVNIRVTQSGSYWLKASSGLCSSSDTIDIRFTSPPLLYLGADTTLCPRATLVLNPSIPNADYLWQDASIRSTYKVDKPGQFFVTIKQGACIIRDTISVAYFNSTVIDLGEDLRFCKGDSALVDAGPGFTSYNWSNGINHQRQFISQAGIYSVSAMSEDGCNIRDTVLVMNPYPLPEPELGVINGICEGETIRLDGGASFYTYSWSNGSEARTIDIDSPGIYAVEVVDQHGCKGRDSISIPKKFKLPAQFLGADTMICSYGEIYLKPLFQYENYLWNTGNIGMSLLVKAPGTYWLSVKDENGCTGYDSISVGLKDCMEGIYVPNAFTPNNDRKNDNFKPLLFGIVEVYKFQIYNRFGRLVYQSDAPNEGWDGSYQGVEQNGGAYVWKCTFKMKGNEVKDEKGMVLLIR